jgi:hypothetical protein
MTGPFCKYIEGSKPRGTIARLSSLDQVLGSRIETVTTAPKRGMCRPLVIARLIMGTWNDGAEMPFLILMQAGTYASLIYRSVI